MKRIMIVLTALILFISAATPVFADSDPAVYSYDFDLRFSLNADVFPVRSRSHMQGYADLLDALELKGNITWCPAYESINLNAEIIPVSNPDSAISFRLYGIPSNLYLTSPLLGGETVWFVNDTLMEFAVKTRNNLDFPLQYIALLYPYVTTSAFRPLTSAWDAHIGAVKKNTTISRKTIQSLAEAWEQALTEQSAQLDYWILGLSTAETDHGALAQELADLPAYLRNAVSRDGALKVTFKNGLEQWSNNAGEILYSCTESNSTTDWSLTLPPTENGYMPRLSVSTVKTDDVFSMSARGSYACVPGSFDPDSLFPDTLLTFDLVMDSWPRTLPADADFSCSLLITGALLPNLNLQLHGKTTESGNISLVLSHPVREKGESVSVLTCYGTIRPAAVSTVPRYVGIRTDSFQKVFQVDDQSIADFVQRIVRPMFFGLLDFVYELPARGCQSVMDDLEDYGVLDMLLGQ